MDFFNSRIESGLIQERQEITKQQQKRIHAAKDAVPDDAYDLPLMTLGLSTKVENLLTESGFANVGELAYRLLLVPKSIGDIDGIGPSYIKQIESALEVMIGYQPLPEEYDLDEELVLERKASSEETPKCLASTLPTLPPSLKVLPISESIINTAGLLPAGPSTSSRTASGYFSP